MIPFIIYSKRNFKSLLFIALLIIMPVISLCYSYIGDISRKPVVGLYFDCISEYIFDGIKSDNIDFVTYNDKENMLQDISLGEIDSGYIFDSRFDNAVNTLNFNKSVGCVTSKSSLIQHVANEFVFKEILKEISPRIADRYFYSKGINISADKYYEEFLKSDSVFNIEFEEIISDENVKSNKGCRLSNIFALFIMTGALLNAVTVAGDRKRSIVKYNYICILSSSVLLTISAFVSSLICGEMDNVILFVLYPFAVSAFAYVISFIKSQELICGILPAVITAAIIFCPIVFDIGVLGPYYSYIGYIFPVGFFAAGNIIEMTIYIVVMGIPAFVIKRRRFI